jgi:hypothetical protein
MAIINFKKIATFNEDALTTTTAGDYVLNFGALTTTGDLADGIFATADNVSIFNFAQIETSGLGATGIFVEGSGACINNFGSIHTSGNDDPNGLALMPSPYSATHSASPILAMSASTAISRRRSLLLATTGRS